MDSWPIIGSVGSDGVGTMVWSSRKPVANSPIITPQTDDDFNNPKLGVQWEWNYQPRADKWSLTEHPGFLRLHAFKPLQRDNLKKAGNTLTQCSLRTSTNVVTLALDLSGMADGQVARLCHYSKDYSTIAVRRQDGKLTLESAQNKTITPGLVLKTQRIWLRSEWGLDGKSRYSTAPMEQTSRLSAKLINWAGAIIAATALASSPATTTPNLDTWTAIPSPIVTTRPPPAPVPKQSTTPVETDDSPKAQ